MYYTVSKSTFKVTFEICMTYLHKENCKKHFIFTGKYILFSNQRRLKQLLKYLHDVSTPQKSIRDIAYF